jgi:hypothetical protein
MATTARAGSAPTAAALTDPSLVGPKECAEYMGLRKQFRLSYLCLRPLRKCRTTKECYIAAGTVINGAP